MSLLKMTIDLSEFDDFADDLSRVDEWAMEEGARAVEKGLIVLEQAIVVETPVNMGALRAAFSREITKGQTAVKGAIVNPLPYALPVEKGRRPGRMPPVAAIEMWVVRKLRLRGREARSVAFLIARAIGRRGTKGAAMVEKGFDKAEPHILNIFAEVPDRVLKRLAAA